jgi:hypothetical protein
MNKKSFLKKLVKYLMRRLYVNDHLILFEHKKDVDVISEAKIRQADLKNLSDVLSFQSEHYLNTFRKFILAGDIGYFAYLENRCVHRSWAKSNCQIVYLHPLIPMKLQDGDVFIHWCETAKTVRGKNIYPSVLAKIAKDFTSKKRIMICVNERNQASVKGVKKAGFEPLEIHRIIMICGFKIVWKKSVKSDS